MNRDKLDRERRKAVAKEEQAAGLIDGGIYRIRVKSGGDKHNLQWVRVWIVFYPKKRWWIKQIASLLDETEVENTRRPLDAETKAKLESWL